MKTVEEWLKTDENYKHFDSVVFNVFKQEDLVLYRKFGHLYYGKPAPVTEEAKPQEKVAEPAPAASPPEEVKVEADKEPMQATPTPATEDAQ